jgi:YD repeat-containing protein
VRGASAFTGEGEGWFGLPAITLTNVLLRGRSEIRKLVRIMKRIRFALACALLIWGTATAPGQAPADAVRVTMSMHPDGSRTIYNFDNAQRTAVATTTDPDGKVRQTIRYELDSAGRFSTGEVSGPDGRVRFKSRYKYDDAGRILEEAQSAADGTRLDKIVYSYDSSGKQTGYSVFDASGKLISRTGGIAARQSPSPKPREKTKR